MLVDKRDRPAKRFVAVLPYTLLLTSMGIHGVSAQPVCTDLASDELDSAANSGTPYQAFTPERNGPVIGSTTPAAEHAASWISRNNRSETFALRGYSRTRRRGSRE